MGTISLALINEGARRYGFVMSRILNGIPEDQLSVEFAGQFPDSPGPGVTFADSLAAAKRHLKECDVSYESIQLGLKEYALLRQIQNITHARMRYIEGDHKRVSLPTPTEMTGATRTKAVRGQERQPVPTAELAARLITKHTLELLTVFNLMPDAAGR